MNLYFKNFIHKNDLFYKKFSFTFRCEKGPAFPFNSLSLFAF